MLRYKCIKSFSFTDTLFVTSKAKISRGYSFIHIFVSDKGFVYVDAMKSVSEFPKALKMFSKEVGVLEVFISNSHKCHKSKEVRQFFTRLVRHFKYWEEALNGEIELSSILVFQRMCP